MPVIVSNVFTWPSTPILGPLHQQKSEIPFIIYSVLYILTWIILTIVLALFGLDALAPRKPNIIIIKHDPFFLLVGKIRITSTFGWSYFKFALKWASTWIKWQPLKPGKAIHSPFVLVMIVWDANFALFPSPCYKRGGGNGTSEAIEYVLLRWRVKIRTLSEPKREGDQAIASAEVQVLHVGGCLERNLLE